MDEQVENEELKKSYVERGLFNALFGGYEHLIKKENRIYFVFAVILIITSITTSVLYQLNLYVSEGLLQNIIIFELFCAIVLSVGAIIGGIVDTKIDESGEKIKVTHIIIITGTILAGFLIFYFKIDLTQAIIQILKLIFVVVYIVISSASLYFILVSFHTAKYYKLITYGKSKGRMFFQNILRLSVFGLIGMFIYYFFQKSIDTMIVSVLGATLSLIIFIQMFKLPDFNKKEDLSKKNFKSAKITYLQVAGFYSIYLAYQLSQSFQSEKGISSMISDVFLLVVNVFFIVNGLAKKVDKIVDIEEYSKKYFKFQKKQAIPMLLKKNMGTRASIILALGLGLGYHSSLMDSFLGSSYSVINDLVPNIELISINLLYHRLFVMFGLIMLLISYIQFNANAEFREIFINKYDATNILKMAVNIPKQIGEEIKNKITDAFKDKFMKR